MKLLFICTAILLISISLYGQDSSILTISEYIGYIKKYHPIVKQANLTIKVSEAKLLKARGAFDPKLEIDYEKKEFKSKEYFDKLNTSFKIPTWFGIEIKGSYQDNKGLFLNPESNLPQDGLYNLGVSVSLAKNLFINKRMATLKQAKIYKSQAQADNKLQVNKILYDAILTYFDWLKSYKQRRLYSEFLENAKLRFEGIKKSYRWGEKPAIDTTEARIAYNERKLSLEKANFNYIKTSLELSNYLWINYIPVEIEKTIQPDIVTFSTIDNSLNINPLNTISLENHPKIQSLELKYQGTKIDRRLKRNNLLPQIDVQYNFFSQTPDRLNTFNRTDYKGALSFRFPLFLRKERADLKLTNYKLQAIEYQKQSVKLSLKNKITTIDKQLISYQNQMTLISTIIADYDILLKGEERKFDLGESSLFLLNSRESKLIKSKLKGISLENELLKTKGDLYSVLNLL